MYILINDLENRIMIPIKNLQQILETNLASNVSFKKPAVFQLLRVRQTVVRSGPS